MDNIVGDEREPLIRSLNVNSVESLPEISLTSTSFSLFDPRKKPFRYFSLIFICLLTFGPYFCYVLPGALERELERDLKITTTQFTLFASLYSWPNVILCFFGGFLIDRVLGIKWGAAIFSCIVSLGQILFALGAYVDQVWLMYIGRFVFG
jgi:MFS family permease